MEPVSATREGGGMKDSTALYCASLTAGQGPVCHG